MCFWIGGRNSKLYPSRRRRGVGALAGPPGSDPRHDGAPYARWTARGFRRRGRHARADGTQIGRGTGAALALLGAIACAVQHMEEIAPPRDDQASAATYPHTSVRAGAATYPNTADRNGARPYPDSPEPRPPPASLPERRRSCANAAYYRDSAEAADPRAASRARAAALRRRRSRRAVSGAPRTGGSTRARRSTHAGSAGRRPWRLRACAAAARTTRLADLAHRAIGATVAATCRAEDRPATGGSTSTTCCGGCAA